MVTFILMKLRYRSYQWSRCGSSFFSLSRIRVPNLNVSTNFLIESYTKTILDINKRKLQERLVWYRRYRFVRIDETSCGPHGR